MKTDKQVGSHTRQVFVGVDGGGTKTKALLGCDVAGRLQILGAGQGGPSNPRAVGFEHAFANITQAVHAAFESAEITPQTCLRAVLCLAGAGRDQERLTVESWVKQSGLANQARVVSEAEATLAAVEANPLEQASSHALVAQSADPTTAEIALICGTGSLAWGRLVGSITSARSGGWGYLVGDEGSGFWIGQRLLQLACRAADRRIQDDRVLDGVLRHLQLNHPNDLVHWCYGNAGGRERIAAIAPVAFELQESTGVAEIITSGASELAKMIAAVTEQLGCSAYSLAVTGSVVLHQPDYLKQILGCLNDLHLAPISHACVAEPVRGALRLAAQ